MLTKEQVKAFMTAMKKNGDKKPKDVSYSNVKAFCDNNNVSQKDLLEFIQACGDQEMSCGDSKGFADNVDTKSVELIPVFNYLKKKLDNKDLSNEEKNNIMNELKEIKDRLATMGVEVEFSEPEDPKVKDKKIAELQGVFYYLKDKLRECEVDAECSRIQKEMESIKNKLEGFGVKVEFSEEEFASKKDNKTYIIVKDGKVLDLDGNWVDRRNSDPHEWSYNTSKVVAERIAKESGGKVEEFSEEEFASRDKRSKLNKVEINLPDNWDSKKVEKFKKFCEDSINKNFAEGEELKKTKNDPDELPQVTAKGNGTMKDQIDFYNEKGLNPKNKSSLDQYIEAFNITDEEALRVANAEWTRLNDEGKGKEDDFSHTESKTDSFDYLDVYIK